VGIHVLNILIVVELAGMRPFGRCRNKWEENIKIGLKETV
jgi:hypothetical protein